MEQLNIAEILKDCPRGMELDCTMCDNVQLDYVLEGNIYPIKVQTPEGQISLNKYGCYSNNEHAKCIIYPKGKTTWEEFVPPGKFKDRDAVATTTGLWIGITAGGENGKFIPTYCVIHHDGEFEAYLDRKETWVFTRLATEEEKAKLFQAIKENGYKWNAETKSLEKLIEPKFKVGNKVRHKTNHNVVFTIDGIEEDFYTCAAKMAFGFNEQDNYELVPDKFDITTLKPFDKVLVKDDDVWSANLYSHYNCNSDKPFVCVGWSELNSYCCCIPYEGNEYLLGTKNDCDEYYKTW